MRDSFSAMVAGLRLVFQSDEVVFSEVGKKLMGFAEDVSQKLPPVSETILVTVGLAEGISFAESPLSSFWGEAKPEEKEYFPYSWRISRTGEATEEIVVVYDNPRPYKAVRAIVRPEGVRLEVEPVEELKTIDPYFFPLFNLLLSRLLLPRGGFLIHSSCVYDPVSGAGLLFTAPSGTGKSTMAKLWEKQGAVVLNDDMLAVRQSAQKDGAPWVLPIPMPYYTQRNAMTRLNAVFLLNQSPDNVYSVENGALAVAHIMSNVVQQPLDDASALKLLDNVSRFASAVKTVALGFKPDADVVSLVRKLVSSWR